MPLIERECLLGRRFGQAHAVAPLGPPRAPCERRSCTNLCRRSCGGAIGGRGRVRRAPAFRRRRRRASTRRSVAASRRCTPTRRVAARRASVASTAASATCAGFRISASCQIDLERRAPRRRRPRPNASASARSHASPNRRCRSRHLRHEPGLGRHERLGGRRVRQVRLHEVVRRHARYGAQRGYRAPRLPRRYWPRSDASNVPNFVSGLSETQSRSTAAFRTARRACRCRGLSARRARSPISGGTRRRRTLGAGRASVLSIRRRSGMQSSSSEAPPPRIVARFSNGTIGTTPSGFAATYSSAGVPFGRAAHGGVEREPAGLERLAQRRRPAVGRRRAGRARAPIRATLSRAGRP